MSPLLSVRELSVDFITRSGARPVLEGLSFDLGAGEILGLIGESGSGKSVTALAIMGLLDRAARIRGGRILFQGRDLLAMTGRELQAWRGAGGSIIFQNPQEALNPLRRVGDQLADVIARHSGAGAAEVRDRVLAALREVRIQDPERRLLAYPHELSGGQCQRVGIAIALASAPELLVADEATTGLDVTNQARVMDLLQLLARDRGLAVVLITHDLALAAEYSDRLLFLQGGRIAEAGPTRQMLATPTHPGFAGLVAAARALTPDLQAGPALTPQAEAADPGLRMPGPPEALWPPDGAVSGAGWTDPEDRAAAASPLLLEVSGLGKDFPLARRSLFGRRERLRAVDGVDLQIQAGEAVGLVGESGSGKSTLARLVSRLIDPDSGHIRFDGRDIGTIPAPRLARSGQRRDIQMVFQDPLGSLNPRFTGFQAIADPLKVLRPPGNAAALKAEVEAAATAVGLPLDLLDRLPHRLSGGQRARIGIARALVVQPRLLVLDEPTSLLDVSVRATVVQLLDRLRRERGIALLFVSHDLNLVRLLCSRVLVMYRGKVVESGAAAQVCAQPSHPYTKALLSAVPRLEPRTGASLAPEDGN